MIKNKDYTDAYGRRTGPEDNEYQEKPLFKSGYKNFFDGYSSKTILNESGKPVNIRVYTGALFHQTISDRERLQRKFLYSFCLAGALLLLIGGLALPIEVNSNIWCFITAMPSFIMYFRLVFAFIAYCPAGQDFKLHEYKDGAQMIAKYAAPASYLPAIPALASLIFQIYSKDSFSFIYLIYIAMLAQSGFLIAFMGSAERKIIYTVMQSGVLAAEQVSGH